MALVPQNLSVAGTLNPIRSPLSYRLSRIGGSVYTVSYKGLADQVQALQSTLWASGATEVEFRQEHGQPTAEIVATYQGNPNATDGEVAIETVELDFNRVNVPLAQSSMFNDIDLYRFGVLKGLIDDLRTVSTKAEYDLALAGVDPLLDQTELNYVLYHLAGIESLEIDEPVVRYTRTVTDKYTVEIGLYQQGMVFTSDEVKAMIPTSALFSIPASINGYSLRDLFILGWKKDCRVSALSNGNYNMTETYHFSLWPNVYPTT